MKMYSFVVLMNGNPFSVQFKKELFENVAKERKPFLEKESRSNVKDETVGPSGLKDNNTTLSRKDVDNDEIRKSIDKGKIILLSTQAFKSNA